MRIYIAIIANSVCLWKLDKQASLDPGQDYSYTSKLYAIYWCDYLASFFKKKKQQEFHVFVDLCLLFSVALLQAPQGCQKRDFLTISHCVFTGMVAH